MKAKLYKQSHQVWWAFLSLLLILSPRLGMSQDASKYGGTVVIGMKGEFDSLNELNAADSDALQVIQHMLFMSLTRLDENLDFVPCLASVWEFSNGDSTLTYHLRRDVFWIDGKQTTAEDVLFTYQTAKNPDVAYPANSRFDLVEKVTAPDSFTVKFHFQKPYPDALFDTQIPILPKHVLSNLPPEKISTTNFNRRPITDGPFKLVEWKTNQHLIFEANPNYAFGRPFLDRVVFVIVPDETVLLNKLLNQEVDIIPSMRPRDFKKVDAQRSLKSVKHQGREFSFVGWNLKRHKLSREVRRAFSYAINKEEIISTLLRGFAEPAWGPLLPYVWAYDKELADKAPHYDPEKAKMLLAEAGWVDSDSDGILDQNGIPMEINLVTNVGSQIRKDTAIMIQAQLKRIGVKVNIELIEWNLFIDRIFAKRDFDAVILAWEAGFNVNPTDIWHSKAIDDGYNFVSYQNPRVDYLLETARRLSDPVQAQPYWHEFQRIVVDDAPYTFLFIPDVLIGYNRRLHGVQFDVRGFLADINKWWIPSNQRYYPEVKLEF